MITRLLGALALLLMMASITGQFMRLGLGHGRVKGLVPLFYLDHEQNIPTFFSVLMGLFAALLLAVITALNKKRQAPHVAQWGFLSSGFLLIAYDEAFQIHERLSSPFSGLLGDGNLGVFYYAWVLPGIALIIALGLLFSRFLLHLPAITRFRFLIAAALFAGGALGMELLGGRHAELFGQANWTYMFIATVEEALEMAGLIVFIWALLKYCTENFKEVTFRFEGRQGRND